MLLTNELMSIGVAHNRRNRPSHTASSPLPDGIDGLCCMPKRPAAAIGSQSTFKLTMAIEVSPHRSLNNVPARLIAANPPHGSLTNTGIAIRGTTDHATPRDGSSRLRNVRERGIKARGATSTPAAITTPVYATIARTRASA